MYASTIEKKWLPIVSSNTWMKLWNQNDKKFVKFKKPKQKFQNNNLEMIKIFQKKETLI